MNQQMEALTGCSREELIGTPFKTHFTDPARAEDGIRLVLRESKVTNYELTARSKKGKETVVSYNATTFYDQSGKLQGVFAAARDITEQKKLEQQLREQQAYNRGLIESSVDGLVTVDPTGIISDVNEQMCRMTGYARTELIGSPFAEYFTEPERATEGVKQTFETGVVTEYALDPNLAHSTAPASVFQRLRVPRPAGQRSRHLCLRPRHHRPRPLGGEAARAANLSARPDRKFGGRPDHRGPHRIHHRRERADVPHDGLRARRTDRLDLQAVFHRARPGGPGRQAHA